MENNYFVIKKVRDEDYKWWNENFVEPEEDWAVVDGYMEECC